MSSRRLENSGGTRLPAELTGQSGGDKRAELARQIYAEGMTIGIPELEREVWERMPERFRFLYELLWLRAFGRSVGGAAGSTDGNTVSGTKRVTRTSTGQTETRGGAHAGKRLAGASEKTVVSNDRALEQLRKIDRRLRTLAKDMAVFLGAKEHMAMTVRRCSSCKRFGEAEWLYCPWDARPMEEVD